MRYGTGRTKWALRRLMGKKRPGWRRNTEWNAKTEIGGDERCNNGLSTKGIGKVGQLLIV